MYSEYEEPKPQIEMEKYIKSCNSRTTCKPLILHDSLWSELGYEQTAFSEPGSLQSGRCADLSRLHFLAYRFHYGAVIWILFDSDLLSKFGYFDLDSSCIWYNDHRLSFVSLRLFKAVSGSWEHLQSLTGWLDGCRTAHHNRDIRKVAARPYKTSRWSSAWQSIYSQREKHDERSGCCCTIYQSERNEAIIFWYFTQFDYIACKKHQDCKTDQTNRWLRNILWIGKGCEQNEAWSHGCCVQRHALAHMLFSHSQRLAGNILNISELYE